MPGLEMAEWLAKSGFVHGNPFAHKQADIEIDQLEACFVEHPAYNSMLEQTQRSTILHAARGAGKSTTYKMFVQRCLDLKDPASPLVIELTDWTPFAEQLTTSRLPSLQDYIDTILRQALVALTHQPLQSIAFADSESSAYFSWLYTTYQQHLTWRERRVLEKRNWMIPSCGDETYHQVPPRRQLEQLVEALHSIGYSPTIIVVDGIDESLGTVAHWERGADLIAPLVGNVQLLEIPGLVFKFFVPTEIAAVLLQQQKLRDDRILTFVLDWNGSSGMDLLQELLRLRLEFFSDGAIQSMAMLTDGDLRDIDHILCQAAAGSPRQLLNLAEQLCRQCAKTATDQDYTIKRMHLDSVLHKSEVIYTLAREPVQSGMPDEDQPEVSAIPRLVMCEDGSIWRGPTELQWDQLTPLQLALLTYLYEHRGKRCRKPEIKHAVWREEVGDDTYRKRILDLIQRIEPDPESPIYIKRFKGGDCRLENAGEPGDSV